MAQLIQLTVEQDLDDNRDISALDISNTHKEAVIDKSEAAKFIADCQGWDEIAVRYSDGTTFTNHDRFLIGFGVVLTITVENWMSWLEAYEVLEA